MADQRDIGHRPPGALFSMDAADNAEVVPPDAPRGPDSMWSTDSRHADGGEQPAGADPYEHTVRADRSHDDDPWQRMGSTARPGGWAPPQVDGAGVFSAEPVDHDQDVLDEDEVLGELTDDDPWTPVGGQGSPLFSNGRSSLRAEPVASPPEDPWQDWYEPRPRPGDTARAQGPPPFVAPDAVAGSWGGAPEPAGDDVHVAPSAHTREPRTEGVVGDPHGFDLAIGRLGRSDQERAHVPLSVCGALLFPGEQVLGVVVGQMLGRTAAVVATRGRVLIVNDRRWQPIVDIYPIDERLVVRGRHDRQVAALSFADDERLSMVDGITEVDLAIDLADAIRHPDLSDDGASEEF